MTSTNFYIIKLKNLFFPILFSLFTVSLIFFSSSCSQAVKLGLSLWVNSVVPTLFPFFIATELLSYTNIVSLIGRFFNIFMKPIFNIRGEGSFAFIMGIISGYPVGAKIASDFRKNNICSKEECERLLSFTNNSGPLFILGTVGITMFKNSTIGILLLITHLLGSITVGFLFRFWKSNKNLNRNTNSSYINTTNNTIHLSNLGEVLSKSITNSISTIFLIGGFIVVFSIITAILSSTNIIKYSSLLFVPIFNFFNIDISFIEPLLFGIFEITNGINNISNILTKNISTNIIFTAFLLGFGGISILLQVWSIVSKTDLSIKPYIYGKVLHGLFSSFYTFLIISLFPIFNFNV